MAKAISESKPTTKLKSGRGLFTSWLTIEMLEKWSLQVTYSDISLRFVTSGETILKPILIGILEDDVDQSALLEVWLEDAGYEPQVYASGPKFIRAIQQQGFDLLLLDWNLPEMSGLEVLEWVRSNIREHIPVLFLTTREEEKARGGCARSRRRRLRQ